MSKRHKIYEGHLQFEDRIVRLEKTNHFLYVTLANGTVHKLDKRFWKDPRHKKTKK